MNENELRAAAAEIAADMLTEMRSAATVSPATLATGADLTERSKALQTERERRERAGVRVQVSADGFNGRSLCVAYETTAFVEAERQHSVRHASALAAMLARAVGVLEQMGEALAAPERAVAARELAEAEALAAAEREAAAPKTRLDRVLADMNARGVL